MSTRPLALGHSEQHQDLGVLPPLLPPRQPQQRHGTGSNQEDQLQPHKPGLGYAAFQWLTMRCGVETVKPDVHTRRFTQRCLGRTLTDTDIVELVTRTARQLSMPARSLDLAIWEHESG